MPQEDFAIQPAALNRQQPAETNPEGKVPARRFAWEAHHMQCNFV